MEYAVTGQVPLCKLPLSLENNKCHLCLPEAKHRYPFRGSNFGVKIQHPYISSFRPITQILFFKPMHAVQARRRADRAAMIGESVGGLKFLVSDQVIGRGVAPGIDGEAVLFNRHGFPGLYPAVVEEVDGGSASAL